MNGPEIAALARQGKFNGKVLHGNLEETHISWVILSPSVVFKIKKPLKLSFLDFSTVAKRREFCKREVWLNSRFSDIYLGVVPIKKTGSQWYFGGGRGATVDFAVQMKRMRSSKRMDFLLMNGKVKAAHIEKLARKIASFHKSAKLVHTPFSRRFLRDAFDDLAVVKHFTANHLGNEYSRIIVKSLAWNDSFLKTHARRCSERIRLGFQRDLHGDLHSGNIFLYAEPVIFDCIEFNDRFRQVDVIDEVAFLCMDLEAFGERKLSALFLDRYASLFPSFDSKEDLEIYYYYKCYRANVRAKVHALAAAQEEEESRFKFGVDTVRKYLNLVAEYMG